MNHNQTFTQNQEQEETGETKIISDNKSTKHIINSTHSPGEKKRKQTKKGKGGKNRMQMMSSNSKKGGIISKNKQSYKAFLWLKKQGTQGEKSYRHVYKAIKDINF